MPHHQLCRYFEGAGECTCSPITAFTGPHFFLSNFYPSVVFFEGLAYRSSEHAFQAAKTPNHELKLWIRDAEEAVVAKRRGRSASVKATMSPDWDSCKVEVMRLILVAKFSDPSLRDLLKWTAPKKLVEGNWWGDTFWGQCPLGDGQNWLGRLLMDLRDAT